MLKNKDFIKSLEESIDAKKSILKILNKVEYAIEIITKCINNGNKILICGNGG